ncbi:hypothetical protein [Chroococcidiopsis sp.]
MKGKGRQGRQGRQVRSQKSEAIHAPLTTPYTLTTSHLITDN